MSIWKEGYKPSWQEIQKAWAWAYEHNYVYGSIWEVVSDFRTYKKGGDYEKRRYIFV